MLLTDCNFWYIIYWKQDILLSLLYSFHTDFSEKYRIRRTKIHIKNVIIRRMIDTSFNFIYGIWQKWDSLLSSMNQLTEFQFILEIFDSEDKIWENFAIMQKLSHISLSYQLINHISIHHWNQFFNEIFHFKVKIHTEFCLRFYFWNILNWARFPISYSPNSIKYIIWSNNERKWIENFLSILISMK